MKDIKNSKNLYLKFLYYLMLTVMIIILSPLLVLFIFIFFIFFIVPAPLEYLFYKKSSYFKTIKTKYHIGIIHGLNFNIFNLIKKYNYPYDYFEIDNGAFYLKNTHNPENVYIFLDYENKFYDIEKQNWFVESENPQLNIINIYDEIKNIYGEHLDSQSIKLKFICYKEQFDKYDLEIAKLK